jgi:uncharacterized membrane protein (DUF4010 family)
MEQRRLHLKEASETRFGTDRTYTFIGILGFVLYRINTETQIPFLGGGLLIGLLMSVYYYNKITIQKEFGFTSIIVALITYCLAPLIYTQPEWLVILLVIAILVFVELKESLFELSKKIDNSEFTTLAKFLVIAGVILPLLPDNPISETINISPFKFWLAIVAVSAISYLSYLLKKFVFPQSGIVLSGLLGGLYSSTATTFILARKSREIENGYKIVASIFLATTIMFFRVLLLAFIFNQVIAIKIAPVLGGLALSSTILSLYFLRLDKKNNGTTQPKQLIEGRENPLEFKASLVFGILFIAFAILTGLVIKYYGSAGINVLSFVVGVTDIDPFIINIFQSKWNIAGSVLSIAVINAITSNNILKMIYAIILSDRAIRKPILAGFSILIVLGLLTSIFYDFN